MPDVILDAILDSLKLLPYLLATFLLLEFIEHKLTKKSQEILAKRKAIGPLVGGALGAIPQCGFSAMAANLFSCRVITIGTLVAIFLSTSDEMLPIMLSENADILTILKIVGAKMVIGIVVGFLLDFLYSKFTKKTPQTKEEITKICEHDHCMCKKENLFLSSVKHTLKIGVFILIINLIINIAIFYIGEENLANLLLNKNIFTYFIAGLIGLIPNCAGSIIITQLYLTNFVTLGTLFAGLLAGSGIGTLLLFKTNKNIKQNIFIVAIVYLVGIVVGLLVDIIF